MYNYVCKSGVDAHLWFDSPFPYQTATTLAQPGAKITITDSSGAVIVNEAEMTAWATMQAIVRFESPTRIMTWSLSNAAMQYRGPKMRLWLRSDQRAPELVVPRSIETALPDMGTLPPYPDPSSGGAWPPGTKYHIIEIEQPPSSPVRLLPSAGGGLELPMVTEAQAYYKFTAPTEGVYSVTIRWEPVYGLLAQPSYMSTTLHVVPRPFATGLTVGSLLSLYPELGPGLSTPLEGVIGRSFEGLSLRLRADMRQNPGLTTATEHDVDGAPFLACHAAYAYAEAIQSVSPERGETAREAAKELYDLALTTALVGMKPNLTRNLTPQFVRSYKGGPRW